MKWKEWIQKEIHVAKRLIGYVVKSNGKPFSMSSEIKEQEDLKELKDGVLS